MPASLRPARPDVSNPAIRLPALTGMGDAPAMSEATVWVFNGWKARFPCAVFSTRAAALAWIERSGVRGTLTEMPLDESTYDHTVRTGGRVPPPDPRTVATWSSRLSHEHFDDEND
jgi:hypothetical protein